MALWYGLRIVLRPDAHFTPFFNNRDLCLTSSPSRLGQLAVPPFERKDRMHNRNIAAKVFGKHQQLKSIQALVSDLKTGKLKRRCP